MLNCAHATTAYPTYSDAVYITERRENLLPRKNTFEPFTTVLLVTDYNTEIATLSSYYALLKRIEEISKFENNWNDNNASAFNKIIINNSKEALTRLSKKSNALSIFPTASDTIQFELTKDDGYFEIEIGDNSHKFYYELNDGTSMASTFVDLNQVIIEFLKYAR